MIDRLLLGLDGRGHDVTLVCGGPVTQHRYDVVQAGGEFTQYLAAPVVCATRFRRADVVIDVENGLPYFSPFWRRSPSLCLVHHVHTDQWGDRFPGRGGRGMPDGGEPPHAGGLPKSNFCCRLELYGR